jgi:hypothetical protein
MARSLGLFVLVEDGAGQTVGPRWTVFDQQTGKEILAYWPMTRFCRHAAEGRRVDGWAEALRLAASRRQTPGGPGAPASGQPVHRLP